VIETTTKGFQLAGDGSQWLQCFTERPPPPLIYQPLFGAILRDGFIGLEVLPAPPPDRRRRLDVKPASKLGFLLRP
jgi:hypothetical protein